MKRAGYSVDCLNLNHKNGDINRIITDFLNKKKYDFVCTGHMALGFEITEKIISSVRMHSTKPKIILGGAIITSEREAVFNSLNPDFAVIGEGEETIVELLNAIEKNKPLNKLRGIEFRDKSGNLIFTGEREAIRELDKLPFPDFDGLGFSEKLNNTRVNQSYSYNSFDYPKIYPILCSRSCPFQCTFCYHSIGSLYRTRSLNNIMKELQMAVKKYKINIIEIYDDLFALNRARLKEFCKRINNLRKEISWQLKWTCQLHARNMDSELLGIMKDAGCDVISYGFESYSPEVLKSMRKPITPQDIDRALKETLKAGIGVQANFIFGDSAETVKTAYKTLIYWKKECYGQVNLFFVKPYPGSVIYQRCIQKGIIKDRIHFIKNEMNNIDFNMTDSMTNAEFKKLQRDIIRLQQKYYSFVTPLSLKKIKKDVYSVLTKCPFCRKIVNYKNCLIENKRDYEFPLICRNCHMRYYVRSIWRKIGYYFYPIIKPLYRAYLKRKEKLSKNRI